MALEPLAADLTGSATVAADLIITQARATKQVSEVLAASSLDTRVTKQVSEVLAASSLDTRATKQVSEVLATSSLDTRVTKQVVEVLHPSTLKNFEVNINLDKVRFITGTNQSSDPYLNTATVPVTTLPMSFGCWVRMKSFADLSVVFLSIADKSFAEHYWNLYYTAANNKFGSYWAQGTGSQAPKSESASTYEFDTDWHYLLVKITGTNLNILNRLSVDGGAFQSSTGGSSASLWSGLADDLSIGRVRDTTPVYPGRNFEIAKVSVWNTSFSDAQAAQVADPDFDPLTGVGASNLIAYWKLLDGDSDIDYKGSNDLTAVNSPSYSGIAPWAEVAIVTADVTNATVIEPLAADLTGSAAVTADLSGLTRQFAADVTGSSTLVGNIVTPNPLEPDGGINVTATVVALLDKNIQHTSSTLSFTQAAAAFNLNSGNTLGVSQSVSVNIVSTALASNALAFTQSATLVGIYNKTVVSILGSLDQTVVFARVLPTEAASSSITFTSTADFARPTLNALGLTQVASGEIGGLLNDVTSTLVLTSTPAVNIVDNQSLNSLLTLTHTVDPDQVTTKTATNTLVFTQLAVPITLGTKTYVILQAPCEALQTSIVLPAPIWGDTENVTSEMRLRRSMNGRTHTTIVTNKNRRLNYTFRILDELKAIELQEFIRYHHSDLIKMTNWKGEVWKVNILNNPVDFIQTRRNAFDVTLEFEGTKLYG